jgi:hypothetical protein
MSTATRYNHAFSLGFSLETECSAEGDTFPTNAEMRAALLARVKEIEDGDHWEETCELFDTYVVQDD